VRTIGELVTKSEADLLRVRSFGKTSLREVKQKLAEMGLSLGMTIGGEAPKPAPGPMEYASSDDLGDGESESPAPQSADRSGAAGSDWSMVVDRSSER
jgi:DNA-directed RNA polymerase subunit alpha